MDKKIMQLFMQDYWNWLKKYLNPTGSDDFWKSFCDESKELARKYNEEPIFVEMIIGALRGVDKQYAHNNML